jgi:hypothetical protein
MQQLHYGIANSNNSRQFIRFISSPGFLGLDVDNEFIVYCF